MPDRPEDAPRPVIPTGPSREAKPEDASLDTSRAGFAESIADRAESSSVSPLPEMFGRYRILRTLGEGAMGAVFLAEDTQLQRQVALKIPKFAGSPDGWLLERFLREARAAATIRHPHICPVFDVGEIGGTHFLTMAFIQGKPLSQIIRSGRQLSERQIASFVRKLALGLAEAHTKGVVHRDLKPANVMVDGKGEPVVTDFGLARRAQRDDGERITHTGAIVGTPAYMSPEQVEADPESVGPASDIYSLGVIFYELLTGQIPFRGSVTSVLAQIVTKAPQKPSEVRPALDPRLEGICLRMMARAPQERIPTMDEVAATLGGWLRDTAAISGSAAPSQASVASAAVVTSPQTDGGTDSRPLPYAAQTKPGLFQLWIALGCGAVAVAVLVAVLFRPGGRGRESVIVGQGAIDSSDPEPTGDVSLTAADEPDDPDPRKAAELILARGGSLGVVVPGDGRWHVVKRPEDFPDKKWAVVSVDLADRKVSDADLAQLRAFAELVYLKLVRSEATDSGIRSLATLTRLEHVDLAGTRITDAGLAHLPPLRRLNLYHTQVTDAGLAELKRMPDLEFLELDGRQLTETGIQNLRGLPALTRLWCFASDEELRRLIILSSLEELALWKVPGDVDVTDAALPALAELSSLTKLMIHSGSMTDDGLASIKPLTHLRSLQLSTPRVSESAVAALRQTLPDCDIRLAGEQQPEPAAQEQDGRTRSPLTAPDATDERPTLVLLATAGRDAPLWRYTTIKPDDNWIQPEFDDSVWSRGKADFSDGYGKPATSWKAANIWLRTEFHWKTQPVSELRLKLKHDETATVFLNGRQVLRRPGHITKYQTFTLPADAAQSLQEGRNVIAVHCVNRHGGQFIDAGLTAFLPASRAPSDDETTTTPLADDSAVNRAMAERLFAAGHRVYMRSGDREFRLADASDASEPNAQVTRIVWKEASEVTAADLEALRALRNLHGLRLAGCRLTDADALPLAALSSLRELDLSGTLVGAGVMNVLRLQKGLEWVDLTDTRLNATQLGNLRDDLPGCQVLPLNWLSAPASKRAMPRDMRRGAWNSLFNGNDLTGWTRRGGKWAGTWKVTADGLRCNTGNLRGWLSHDADFADFQLQTEFRFEKHSARTALCLRMPGQPRGHDGIPASGDLRINLTSDGPRARRGTGDDPTHQNGTLNGLAPPRFEVTLLPDIWHRAEVRAVSTQITVWINDRPTVAVDLATRQSDFPRDAALWAPSGRIGIANSNTPVEYRNIEARSLGKPAR